MLQRTNIASRLVGIGLLAALTSGCSTLGFEGTPQQMAEARAVHLFDESRLPFGQRVALAQASYKPRMFGYNPYFGR